MAFRVAGFARVLGIALSGFLLTQACGNADEPEHAASGSGGRSGTSAGEGGTHLLAPDLSNAGAAGSEGASNPYCGVGRARECEPDDARACASYVSSDAELMLGGGGTGGAGGAWDAGGGGARGDAGSSAGQAGAAGADAQGHGDGPSADNGGESSAGGALGAGGALDVSGAPSRSDGGAAGNSGTPEYACRVTRRSGEAFASCELTGRGALDAPCFTGGDCGAGLACVSLDGVARCRPYCCGGDDACGSGTYCADRPLRDDSISSSHDGLNVPVCVPADGCDLGEAYPCPDGRSCQCGAGTACQVVRADGATACMAPGDGQLDDPCPCAYGFVCARASNRCLKLCSTDEDAPGPSCDAGRCQSSAELPAGFGVCVGG